MCKRWTSGLLAMTLAALSLGADWPQWQGIDRTAISKETGLLKEWPKDGPPLAWKAKGLGGGYSTPSVAAGRIFGMSYRGDEEVVWALDEKDGKEIWVTKLGPKQNVQYNEGPRCTPTVDGDLIYCMGVTSELACVEAATGKIVWHKNLVKDFSGKLMSGWGFSESPLIDGDKLIVTPGGKTSTLLALNKKTGETVWQSVVPGGESAGYSSVVKADVQGVAQYIQFLQKGVVGVNAADGKYLWRYDAPANNTANISTPVYSENTVFAASAYGKGGGLAELSKEGTGAFKAEQKYFTKKMENHHGGMILVDGYLYGAGNPGLLICIEFKSGKIMWEERKTGKCSLAFADGMLYCRDEKGPALLVEANSKMYVEKGKFNPPDRSKANAWSHPVIANGKLYLRDQDVLLCYDIKAK